MDDFKVFFSDELYSKEDLPSDFLSYNINPIPTTVEYFCSGQEYPPDRKKEK